MGYTFRKRIKVPAAFDPRNASTAADAYVWVIAIVLISLLAFVAAMLDIDG